MSNNYPLTFQNSVKKFDLFFVDLDGTMIFEDLTFLSFKAYLSQKPWLFLKSLYEISVYRQRTKKILAEKIPFEELKYTLNAPAIELLKYLKAQSKTLVLATGSSDIYAQKIAQVTGLFDAVLATDLSQNLIGKNKLEKMRAFACERPFVYIGNSQVDLEVWSGCDAGIVVNANTSVKTKAKQATTVLLEI